jgi:ATP-dependent DNA helicase RecQ
MTRAREALCVMRAEGGRNPHLVDMGTVDGVVDLLPDSRPAHRPDLDFHRLVLGPADVDIGIAGRHGPGDPVHRHIAAMVPGNEVFVLAGQVKTGGGQVVGRLAK